QMDLDDLHGMPKVSGGKASSVRTAAPARLVTPFAKMPAWTWFVRPRKASTMTTNGAGLDAGEGNPESVIILQNRFGVGPAVVTSSVG
ncbi:hypothetical protein GW17_00028861, partial [Ensete ventricosum]